MFRIESYIQSLIETMKHTFGNRLLYVGLQGSYLREEATEKSDIDIMVILDRLSVQDLTLYKEIIQQMEYYEKSCGFICGIDEFSKWSPLEFCHILHSTKDYYGNLLSLMPEYHERDIVQYIKISLGNLYHEICHRYLHSDREKNYLKLPTTYRNVFFILQNLYYLQTGVFHVSKKDLISSLVGDDKDIMVISFEISSDKAYNFELAFEKLFTWCQNTFTTIHTFEQQINS